MPTDHEIAATLNVSLTDLRREKDRLARADLLSLATPMLSDVGDPISLVDTVPAPHGMNDPEVALIANERAHMLRAAMRRLPAHHQTVLRMAYIERMSGQEIGEILGVSASRVSKLIAEGRRRIQLDIDSYERETPRT